MKLITTLTDKDILPDTVETEIDSTNFFNRSAARAVVVNDAGEIALLKVSNYGYHKIPGGGIDPGEDINQALRREMLEEIGCEIEIISEVGQILEHRNQSKFKQTSYCFLVKQIGQQKKPDFTEHELADGFEMIWVKNIDEAITICSQEATLDYGFMFMKKRDLIFLQTAKELL